MESGRNIRMRNNLILDLFGFLRDFVYYLFLRLRQAVFYSWAFLIWLSLFFGDAKQELVKRMFWGRSTFYRTTFQLAVGILTIILGIGGLAGRLNLFTSGEYEILAFPSETLGDADYLDEGASIQAIVASSSLSWEFEVQIYKVQKGDTLSSIAEKFSVSSDTLRWANGIAGDYLKIGQELKILPINGVIHKVKKGDSMASVSQKYGASEQDIYDINWLDSKVLMVDQELLVPNGSMPQPKPIIKPAVVPTVPQVVIPSGNGTATGNFIRPAGCGKITNWYSGWHRGVDIAQSGGCQIIASDGGVVSKARWSGRGGLQIEINHGNGFQTLYAHAGSIYVKEGQNVTRGQPIGYMGCTGSCTGTHLHFGVILNGIAVNPLIYVPI